MTETYSFGTWMQQRRKARRLTQRELAAKASCAVATVKKIEADERRPSPELAVLLASALAVPEANTETFVACARGQMAVDALWNLEQASVPAATRIMRPVGAMQALATTPFVGREAEIAKIWRVLENPDCRLLTLLGPGGTGKTRLALEVMDHARELWSDGTAFVPLVAVTQSQQVPGAIAQSLNISAENEDQLSAYLADKTMLLVLDNCEQLGADVRIFSQILAQTPGITLLVTSRESLQLTEEWIFPVAGLDQAQAVELFAGAARRALSVFDVDAYHDAVLRICNLVENLPLALELAASWVTFLNPDQIAEHIQKDIDFLAANVRNLPPRHRSIRAVFDHSWALLQPTEQNVLMALSVFRGGWRFQEAAEIAGASMKLLRGLMEKSLVQADHAGRYDLHELTRQYAAEKLTESGEHDAVRQHHAEVYLQRAGEWVAQMHTAKAPQAYALLEAEIDNFRAALDWLHTSKAINTLLEMVTALFLFWFRRGHWREATTWIQTAIDLGGDAATPQMARALSALPVLLVMQGRTHEVGPVIERAQHLAEKSGDPYARYTVLEVLSQGTIGPDAILENFEEALTIINKTDDAHFPMRQGRLAGTYFLIGDSLRRVGMYEKAEELYRESLRRFREMGNVDMIAYPLGNLGRLALIDGRVSEAYEMVSESVLLTRRTGSRPGVADWLQQQGMMALYLGDIQQAESCLEETIALRQEMGGINGRVDVHAAMSLVLLVKGDHAGARHYRDLSLTETRRNPIAEMINMRERSVYHEPDVADMLARVAIVTAMTATNDDEARAAVTYFSAAESIATPIHHRHEAPLQQYMSEALAALRQRLGETTFEATWQATKSMTLKEVFSV